MFIARRVIAIVLQLALLVLPFSGGNAHDRHCADSEHATTQAVDVPCHSLPACATPLMQAAVAVSFVPMAIAPAAPETAARAPLSVTQAPEPPPPRA